MLEPIEIDIPEKILDAFTTPDGAWRPSFYKIIRGGRGSAKSETIARLLLADARSRKTRMLCTRMYQTSIGDSVMRTLEEAAIDMGFLGNPKRPDEFEVLKSSITHKITGTDFIFKGLQRDIGSIKSMKGVSRCWIEEGESVPLDTLRTIEPTFRVEGAEIWVSYNPEHENSAMHCLALRDGDPQVISLEMNWRDNRWFPEILNKQRLRALELDQDAYDWIWEGKTRKISDAVIFRNRVVFTEEFEDPLGVRPFYGLDFGESADPNAGVRCWIAPYEDGEALYISHEAFGWMIELDEVGDLIEGKKIQGQELPGVRDWPLKCDASRPGMIRYLANAGFNASAAEKWSGSVEDGIAHLKAFKKIFVHPRCVNLGQEFRLYQYKTDPKQIDPKTEQPLVLPVIRDMHNHGIDALRYALDGYIEKGGLGLGVWERLAG